MLTFTGARKNDLKVMEWMADHQDELGKTAAYWFKQVRKSGPDVGELLHDGLLTACVNEYPFAYVGAFRSHVNVGFFYGAFLSDPAALLQGTGKRMRHVKVKPGQEVDEQAIKALIKEAYADIRRRIAD